CSGGLGIDSVISLSTPATEIHEAGQRKPVQDTKNDWRRQCNRILSTDGRYTGAPSTCYQPRAAAWNPYRLPIGRHRSIGIDESD
uniref:Uncharacterized protein n=1 Tax=Romanomermis culicivorax TaxID=13658 RepID=A0A915JHX3_ROMCU